MRAAQFNEGEAVNALADSEILLIPRAGFKREFVAQASCSPGAGEHILRWRNNFAIVARGERAITPSCINWGVSTYFTTP